MSKSEDAAVKLRAEEKNGSYDRYAEIMKGPVLEQLIKFCGQNEEFAEAEPRAAELIGKDMDVPEMDLRWRMDL